MAFGRRRDYHKEQNRNINLVYNFSNYITNKYMNENNIKNEDDLNFKDIIKIKNIFLDLVNNIHGLKHLVKKCDYNNFFEKKYYRLKYRKNNLIEN